MLIEEKVFRRKRPVICGYELSADREEKTVKDTF